MTQLNRAHPEILVVSLESTGGWQAAARELAASLQRAGAAVRIAGAGPLPLVRTFSLTDLVQARAARHACERALAVHDPQAIVYCSVTAALLWPRPGAIWLDSVAAGNRPGRHGVWQRALERRRLRQAPLVLAMSERSLAGLARPPADVVVLPSPVHPSAAECSAGNTASGGRDVAVVTYAGDPEKKRLATILAAWSRARRGDEMLVVAGTDRLEPRDGVELAGRLAPADYRALLRRARVFVAAPRREDYGIAPLEALADGCMLVSTPAPGPYPALALAQALDSRLVTGDLAGALRTALDDPLPGYAERAAGLLAPFSREAVDQTIVERVLPVLVPGWGRA